MTTSNPPGPHAGGERRQTVDFDLFGGESEAGGAAAASQALEKTAGQVDFDVFGAGEAAGEAEIAAASPEKVDFDIFGAGDKTQDDIAALPDSDMDAEDATRFTAPPTPGQAASAAPFAAPKPAPAATPAPAPEQASAAGKIVAIVIVIAAIAAAAWFFLR